MAEGKKFLLLLLLLAVVSATEETTPVKEAKHSASPQLLRSVALKAAAKFDADLRKINEDTAHKVQQLDNIAVHEAVQQDDDKRVSSSILATARREEQIHQEQQEVAKRQRMLARRERAAEKSVHNQNLALNQEKNTLAAEAAAEATAMYRVNTQKTAIAKEKAQLASQQQRLDLERAAIQQAKAHLASQEKELHTEQATILQVEKNVNTASQDVALGMKRVRANVASLSKFEERVLEEKANLEQNAYMSNQHALKEQESLKLQRQKLLRAKAALRKEHLQLNAALKTAKQTKKQYLAGELKNNKQVQNAVVRERKVREEEKKIAKEQRITAAALRADAKKQRKIAQKQKQVSLQEKQKEAQIAAEKKRLQDHVFAVQQDDAKRQNTVMEISEMQAKEQKRLVQVSKQQKATEGNQAALAKQEAAVAKQQNLISKEEVQGMKMIKAKVAGEKREASVAMAAEKVAVAAEKAAEIEEKEAKSKYSIERLKAKEEKWAALAAINKKEAEEKKILDAKFAHSAAMKKIHEEQGVLTEKAIALERETERAKKNQQKIARAEAKEAAQLGHEKHKFEIEEKSESKRLARKEASRWRDAIARARAQLRDLATAKRRAVAAARKLGEEQVWATREAKKLKQEEAAVRKENAEAKAKAKAIVKRAEMEKARSIRLKKHEIMSLAETSPNGKVFVSNDGVTNEDLIHKRVRVDVRSAGAPVHVGLHKSKGDEVQIMVTAGVAQPSSSPLPPRSISKIPLQKGQRRTRRRRRSPPPTAASVVSVPEAAVAPPPPQQQREGVTHQQQPSVILQPVIVINNPGSGNYAAERQRPLSSNNNIEKRQRETAIVEPLPAAPVVAEQNSQQQRPIVIPISEGNLHVEHHFDQPPEYINIGYHLKKKNGEDVSGQAQQQQQENVVSAESAPAQEDEIVAPKVKFNHFKMPKKEKKPAAPVESYEQWADRVLKQRKRRNFWIHTPKQYDPMTENPKVKNFDWSDSKEDIDSENANQGKAFERWVRRAWQQQYGSTVPRNWLSKVRTMAYDFPDDEDQAQWTN